MRKAGAAGRAEGLLRAEVRVLDPPRSASRQPSQCAQKVLQRAACSQEGS